MKQNPWTSASLRLLEGEPKLVAMSKQLVAIDTCWRRLLSLPMDPAEKVPGPHPRTTLAATCVRMALALDAIWDEHAELLRRSIANAAGPTGTAQQLSGIVAYLDLGEHTLGALGQIYEGKEASPISNRYRRRAARHLASWNPAAYTNALGWVRETLSPALLDELAVTGIQDLIRLRRGVALTPQEVKQRKARTLARSKLFEFGWKLTDDAVSLLELLPKAPHTVKFVVLKREVSFSPRKLKSLLGHMQAIGLAENKKRYGYRITGFGRALLCFRSERA